MIKYLTLLGKIIGTYDNIEYHKDTLSFQVDGLQFLDGVVCPKDIRTQLVKDGSYVEICFETGTFGVYNYEDSRDSAVDCFLEEIKVK